LTSKFNENADVAVQECHVSTSINIECQVNRCCITKTVEGLNLRKRIREIKKCN